MTVATMPDPVLDLQSVDGVTTCSLLELIPLLRAAEEIGDHKTAASIVSAMTRLAPSSESAWTDKQAA